MSPWRTACDSCSMHKLGLIGREMSLTLTVAAVRTMSAAACYVKWHCCTFWQQRAKTQSINYMVECALVQQTHTVNTYVSCRSSLHSNPQHPNTCLRRSTAPEVGCFHGNQAAAFDDGSHEMTPADSAGSSESPRGRIDGWMGEWVVVVGGVAERKYRKWSKRQLPLAENELHNHSTAHLTFAARVLLPGTKAGSDKNTVSQMRRSTFTWLMLIHVSSIFWALAVRVGEIFKERSMCHHLLSSSVYFFKQINVRTLSFPP